MLSLNGTVAGVQTCLGQQRLFSQLKRESTEGRMGGRDSQEIWDGHVHTAIFKMDNQQDLLYSTQNSAQCYAAAWMRGEFKGEQIQYTHG